MAFKYFKRYFVLSRNFSLISILLMHSSLLLNLALNASAQYDNAQRPDQPVNNRRDFDSNRNPQVATSTAFPIDSSEFARMRNLAKTKVFNLTVGVVVSDRDIIEQFLIPFFDEINSEIPVSSKQTVKLRPIFDQPDLPTKSANPIEAVLKICERFVQQGIGALILRNENSDLMTPVAISYTLSFYQIPIISINDRNNIFSDKSIHSMFMRTVPAYSEQALVMLDIVSKYGWSRIAVLATNDVNGRNFLSNLWPAIQRRNIKVDPYFPFEPGNRMLIKFHLTHLEKSATRVALIYASKEDCLTIAEEATKANLSSSFVWIFNDLIISDMSSTSNSLKLVPPGSLIPRLKHAEDTEEHLRDAIRAVKSSYQSMIRKSQIAKFQSMTKQGNRDKNAQPGETGFSFDYEQRTATRVPLTDEDLIEVANYGAPAPTPKECGGEGAHWPDGHKFLRELKMYKQNPAETGDLAFNTESGDRLNSEYHILNMRESQPHLIPVATWTAEQGLQLDPDQKIMWPSGSFEKPAGVVVSKHLKIVTAVTEPFVNKIRAFPGGMCESILDGQPDIPEGAAVVPCSLPPHGNRNETEHWCCYGYCIDLLENLATKLEISYDLHLVADGKFGARASKSMPDTGSILVNPTGESAPGSGGPGGLLEREVWDGTIGEILNGKADLIVAALTIDNERAQVIDFSNPFKHQGLSIVVKKKQPNSSLASFIQPFQYQLWVLIALSVHVVALILYLLDRFSPFGRFKVNHGEGSVEEEDALNLSSAMWFAWGVLLNSGIGEGTPRSFSARVLGVVWAGFAMIIVASYTANLAAFLVLDRPEAEIAGINDARMRNPSDAYKYGTVKDSAVQAYFKRKVEMSNMYRFMLRFSRSSAQEAIEDVRKGDLDAFIWDSAVLDYETSRDCSLITVGEMFHRSGYGIGMAKDSAWKEDISLRILQFHEDGFMETLDNNWMKSKTCDNSDSQPATLGLENMAGVFMLVGGGIVAGVVLIFVEMAYKRHYGKQERQEVVARAAFDRWRSAVKNKSSRGNGDGGVSYVPSTYSMGSNTRPSESKLNQLFGGNSAAQSYIPMHTMTPSASQPSDLTITNDLGSPRHQSSNPPYHHHHMGGGGGGNVNGPNHPWVGGPAAQSNAPTMLRQNQHQPNQNNPPHMDNASPQIHKNRPGVTQMHQNYPFSGDHSTTVSNSGVTSPRGMYPTGPLDKDVQPNPPNSTSTFGKSKQKNQPQTAFGNKSAPNQNNKNSSTLPHNRPCNNVNTNNGSSHNNNSANPNDSSVSPVTLDLKLFDPDFVREKSSAGRISAKSSRGDLHLT